MEIGALYKIKPIYKGLYWPHVTKNGGSSWKEEMEANNSELIRSIKIWDEKLLCIGQTSEEDYVYCIFLVLRNSSVIVEIDPVYIESV